jgi:hypothetical protein
VAYGTGGGFNDGTYGATRRNTICAVLTYIQSVYDFSNIPSSNPIRLHVDSSYTHTYHTPSVLTLAWGAPYYKAPLVAGSVVNGFVYDYTKTGTDPSPTSYHADMRINFDSIINFYHYATSPKHTGGKISEVNFQNGLDSVNTCSYDLFSTALHVLTHCLGFTSFNATAARQRFYKGIIKSC